MFSFKQIALPFAGLTLAVAGVTGLAVSHGQAQPSGPAVTADQAYAAAQTAQVALAVYEMDGAGLHELGEATAAGTVPAGSLGRVSRTLTVVRATNWPASMQSMVNEWVMHASNLVVALQKEDAAAAAPDADAVHDMGHDISAAAYTWLGTRSVIGGPALPVTSSADDDHDHGH